jgi:hypothetical protein
LGGFLFFRDFDIGDGLLNRRLDDVVKIAPAALLAG